MRRLLLPLLAALALPNAVNAEELIELKPINPHSYKKSSLVKWESEGKRYITFKGTTEMFDCVGSIAHACKQMSTRDPDLFYKKYTKKATVINKDNWNTVLFEYSIDCDDNLYNREDDRMNWTSFIIDQTPFLVAQKYCQIDKWSQLPNK